MCTTSRPKFKTSPSRTTKLPNRGLFCASPPEPIVVGPLPILIFSITYVPGWTVKTCGARLSSLPQNTAPQSAETDPRIARSYLSLVLLRPFGLRRKNTSPTCETSRSEVNSRRSTASTTVADCVGLCPFCDDCVHPGNGDSK